jgi:hypothetical protein
MVADPGPDVLFPDLTCKYVVAAMPVRGSRAGRRSNRVSGWHRLYTAPDGSLCQIRAKVWNRDMAARLHRACSPQQRRPGLPCADVPDT